VEPVDIKIILMEHGNKISHIVAWTFQGEEEHKGWFK
jgi:23S rRNA A1618 N6-methylase RlmF